MSKRYRYLIIVAGAIIFAVIAPIVALYSYGMVFDLGRKNFVETGILAFRAEPKDGQISLDDKILKPDTQSVRFLRPKDYNLKLQKSGYCSWEKNLPVYSGQVTWASPQDSKIYLLKNNNLPRILNQTPILDFWYEKNTVYALEEIIFAGFKDSGESIFQIALPKPAKSMTHIGNGLFLVSSKDEKNLWLINAGNQSIKDISGFFSQPPKLLSTRSGLLSLYAGNLSWFDETKDPSQILDQQILDFAENSGDIYLLKSSPTSSNLSILGQDFKQKPLAVFPPFLSGQIFITSQKQIFVIGNGDLYQIALTPEFLGKAQTVNFSPQAPNLIFSDYGEVSFFNFIKGEKQLIFRSSEKIDGLSLASNIGYAFWQNGNAIKAIELDRRDRQNGCTLYEGANIKKFQADEDNNRLFLLDEGSLKEVDIR